ncbi:YadA family autotransporter adhesin, partial [Bordetella genomosp. 4]|uniref:YadA family autotransporter adhesin n=1 Tax=Bordetella genomosp. 4 TaxID=463044 RepID=UPI0015C5CAA1
VISGNTGTIGGLTNTTFDPNNYTSGQAATEDQLKQVNDVASAGWNVTDAGGNSANIGPNGEVRFEGDSNISVAQTGVDQNGVVAVSLNENIDLGNTGSVTTGNTVMNNDGLAVNDGAGNVTTTTATGTTVADSAGNTTATTAAGTTVSNAAGATTTVGAGTVSVVDAAGNSTAIGGNQISIGGSNPIVISGNTGTIGGLTNTTFDPNNYTSGQAATEDQLKQVNDVASAGWNATDAAGNSANIGPNGVVRFEGDSNISVAQTGVDQNGVVAVSLNENIDLGNTGSVTTGNTVMNNDGLTVNDGAGNTTTVGGNQISVGGSNPIVISGNAGTIGGLTNTTFDPNNYTSGQAATEDQLKQVNDVASAGWNVTDAGGNSANIGPNGVVRFEGDSNISVAQTGVDQNGVVAVSLNQNIDLGNTGSVTTGNTVMNNDGLAVNDGAGNVTTTTATGTTVADGAGNTATITAAGTTVSNAAGATTTVGAGTVSVVDAAGNSTAIGGNQISVGGANPIVISGNTGTIRGLTNTTFDPNNYTSGQAATEDQLKQVNDVASAGWNVSANGDAGANVAPGGSVDLSNTDGNIDITRTGTDLAFNLADDLHLTADGSLTIGDGTDGSVLNNGGLTVTDGANISTVGAGAISITDAAGTTAIGGDQIAIGGLSPIVISGNTGTITGLTNQTVNYAGFGDGSGRAATEEQLKPVTDFIGLNDDGSFSYGGDKYASLQDALNSMHWNVEVPGTDNSGGNSGGTDSGNGNGGSGGSNGGTGGGSPTPIHNGNTVGFVAGDNIVISKTERPNGEGADVKVSMAQDINVNSVTAKTVNAQEVKIENGPVINQGGIDMGGKKIINVGAGTSPTDAVNLGQLESATSSLQSQVNQVRGDMNRLNNKLSAGVASAMATAGLPQAYLPGKSMMAIAGGTYNGESGFAIGVSTVSDNGSWVVKLSGNSNSRGDYGGAVGVGYQW